MSIGFWNVCGSQKKYLFAKIESFVTQVTFYETKSSIIPSNASIRRCAFKVFMVDVENMFK